MKEIREQLFNDYVTMNGGDIISAEGEGEPEPEPEQGTVRYAISCSYNDVLAAVNLAEPGDTVIVPAGEATWDSRLTITKGITLRGAGIDNTIINNNHDNPDEYDQNCLIRYRPSNFDANLPFRITGFTFNSYDKSNTILLDHWSKDSLIIQTKIRIDHNKFTATLGSGMPQAIWCNGMRGVIDNNEFYHTYPIRFPLSCDNGQTWWNNWEGVRYGEEDNNMYVEDNIFHDVLIVADCQYANRYVFRYNTIYHVNESYVSTWDAHGNGGVGYMYGTMGVEIYGNLIFLPSRNEMGLRMFDHRGGKALVCMNVVICQGVGNYYLYNNIRDEYPDSDNPETNPDWQFPNDAYYFLNKKDYTGNQYLAMEEGTKCNNPPYESCPTEDRDYFVGTDDFDGTSGVGYGLLADRPSSPSLNGAGYWATSQDITNLEGMVGAFPTTPISGTLYKWIIP